MSNEKPLSAAQVKRLRALKSDHDTAQRALNEFVQYLTEEHDLPLTEQWEIDLARGLWVRLPTPEQEGADAAT